MSPLKTAINKATDASLTEDDLQLNFDVVDLVNEDSENIEESMEIIKSKLKVADANVILRTISLIDTLAENCGAMMRAEIAKKSFVQMYLVKVVDDSRSESLKYAVIKEIYKLSQSFKDDGSLKGMSTTFESFQSSYPYLCDQAKKEISGNGSLRGNGFSSSNEDEDAILKKVLEESLKDAQRVPGYVAPEPEAQATQQGFYSSPEALATQNVQDDNLNGFDDTNSLFKVIALYDLNRDDTLSFNTGDIITVVEVINDEWYRGCLKGNIGEVPKNYVKMAPKVTSQEITDLKTKLQSSYQVESLLSDLSRISQDLKSRPNVSSNDVDYVLNQLSINQRMDDVKAMGEDLKKVLDLTKMRLQELQNMDETINVSKSRYEEIKNEMMRRNSNSGSAYPPTSQFQGLNINGTGNY